MFALANYEGSIYSSYFCQNIQAKDKNRITEKGMLFPLSLPLRNTDLVGKGDFVIKSPH